MAANENTFFCFFSGYLGRKPFVYNDMDAVIVAKIF